MKTAEGVKITSVHQTMRFGIRRQKINKVACHTEEGVQFSAVGGSSSGESCFSSVSHITPAAAELAVHGFQAGYPDASGFVVLFSPHLGVLQFIAREYVTLLVGELLVIGGFLAVAVVRLVIDHEHVLHAHEIRHDSLNHLSFGFEGFRRVSSSALEELASAFAEINALAPHEGVIVRDDDLGLLNFFNHVARDKFASGEVAI